MSQITIKLAFFCNLTLALFLFVYFWVMFWSWAGSFSWVFMCREDVPWSTREADRVADPRVRSMTGGKRK